MLVLVNEQGADTQSVGSALMPMSVNKVDGLRRRVGPPGSRFHALGHFEHGGPGAVLCGG